MLHVATSISSRLHYFSQNFYRSISMLYNYHQTLIKSFQPLMTDNELLDFLDQILQQCTTVQHCKQIHSQVILTGKCSSAFLAARIISVYARFGRLFHAQRVFDTAPSECTSNLFLWNSILRANVNHGYHEEALKLYVKMQKLGVLGDGFTFPLVIRACAYMGSSCVCRILHGHVMVMGFDGRLHVANELIGMYAKMGLMRDARNVFDRMGIRNRVSWNMMVSGYAFNYDCNGALEIFQRMESDGLEPNFVTWTSLISGHARSQKHKQAMELFGLMRMRGTGMNAEALAVVLSVCSDLGAFGSGKVIHGYVVKCGFEHYLFVKNAMLCVYGKLGDVNGARNLFLEMENKNIVSWNALITSLAEAGLCDEALEIFSQLEKSVNCPPLTPNVVSWSVVISAFASNGRGEVSLELFRQMQLAKVAANAITISNVLSVCADLAVLYLGKEIHGHVIRALMENNFLVGNGLVNMYAKCGCLKEGHMVFETIEMKDLISWNSMISGYGMHGIGLKALTTFDQMIKSGCKPDAVTFVALLSACSHAGLIPEGRMLFEQMLREYGIEPKMEHYACMVDLLGRAGLLKEASKIMDEMPMEPNNYVWSALLNSCRMHKNTEVAEGTACHLFSFNLETSGSYMLLSNIYAASGRWGDSARVRTSARIKGFKKTPGQSWIEIKKNSYLFSAGNVQKGMEKIYGILEELALQMDSEGIMNDNSILLHSVTKKPNC